jgi:single-strand DNA-binding protein
MNYNRSIIVGRVTQDPQLRSTPGGQSVLSMNVATNRAWTDKLGAKQEAVEFHNIVIWGRLAETSHTFLQKGSLVLVEGRLETRSWEDKDGVPHKTTEIIAESVQFGPRSLHEVRFEKEEQPLRAEGPALAGDEGEQSRSLKPMFGDEEEIDVSDIPF